MRKLLLGLMLCFCATYAAAQPLAATTNAPVKKGVVVPAEKAALKTIPRFETPPVIDGKLDDAIWQQALIFKDFVQIRPGDNIAPTQPTEVYLGFDAKTLYLAFRAHETAGQVRATVAKRDQIFNDDFVGVYFDTFNDQRRAYEFIFNPLGIQADAVYTENNGGNEDFSVDVVHESKGTMDAEGYVVEVAIPFKSIRYEAGAGKKWGVHFFRRIQHANGETDSWMPNDRNNASFLSQSGHITGLEGLSTERTLEIIPSLTLSESGERVERRDASNGVIDGFRNNPAKYEVGASIKYSLTPNITLDAAINPDFAQVEADQLLVTTNQRFPLFYEEKRPFFLEGRDIFNAILDNVYTRAIVDPDIAVKLTGKTGRNSFGVLFASDNAPGNFSRDERLEILAARERCLDEVRRGVRTSTGECRGRERFFGKNANDFILRVKRDVGKENHIGIQATSSNFIERHNQLMGVDGRFRLDPQSTFSFHVAGTHSRRFFYDPDLNRNLYRNGNGVGYAAIYEKSKRNLFYVASAVGRSRDYRSDLGFTRRTNTNALEFFIRKQTEPKPKATMTSWNVSSPVSLRFDNAGRIQSWSQGARAFFNFQRQTFFGAGADFYYDRLFEEEFGARRTATRSGAFAGNDPERSTYNKTLFFGGGTRPSKKYGFEAFFTMQRGAFDFDGGGGPKFERVSAAARQFGQGAPRDPGAANGWDINSSVRYQPTDALNLTLDYTKSYLRRRDTNQLAYNTNIYALRATYQFTRFTFARARLDYDTLGGRAASQFLVGWTPNPGTAFYVGYNDDVNYRGYSPITGLYEDSLTRNGRTFFIKMSYLFRKSF